MTTANLTDLVLGWLLAYGPVALGLALGIAALGIPLPSTLLVIAAGAFARQGFIAAPVALLAGGLGAVSGDLASYGVGRFASPWIVARIGATSTWQSAEQGFARRGFLAVYLTRWLITPLALPTNLIAGSQAYSPARYLTAVTLGEATWLLVYGGVGYAAGVQWEALGELVGDLSGLLAGLAVLGLGVFLASHLRRRVRVVQPGVANQG